MRESEESVLSGAGGDLAAALDLRDRLLAASPMVIFHHVRGEETVSYISPSVTRVLGYSPEEARRVFAIWRDFVHPEDCAAVKGRHAQMVRERAPRWEHEYRLRRKDGGYCWMRVFVECDYDSGGVARAASGFALDISAQRQAEEERARILQEEQAQRAALEGLLGAVVALGASAEPDEVLRTLVQQIVALLDAEKGGYAVIRDDRLVFPYYLDNGRWIAEGVSLPLAGVAAVVTHTKRSYRTNAPQDDPNSDAELRARFQLRSELIAPLLDGEGEMLGLLAVANSRRPAGFSERDERLLLALCDLASAIVRRAQDSASRLAAEEERARLEGVILAARSVAHEINQDLGVIVGRTELAQHLLRASQPQLVEHLTPVYDAALRLAEKVSRLQRTARVVTQEQPGIGPMLDLGASSD